MKHVADHAPGFLCVSENCVYPEYAYAVKVRHWIGKPATSRHINLFREMAGARLEFLENYLQSMNGGVLYGHARSQTLGIYLYSVAEMAAETQDWAKTWREFGYLSKVQAKRPDFVAIGRSAGGGSQLLIYPRKHGDAVFEVSEYVGSDQALAPGLSELFGMIASDPAAMLYRLGCYTRYLDGKSGIQWIPWQYKRNIKPYLP